MFSINQFQMRIRVGGGQKIVDFIYGSPLKEISQGSTTLSESSFFFEVLLLTL